MKNSLLLTISMLCSMPFTIAMEKETPEFFSLLPTELRSELVAAVFKTNSNTRESMKTVKKLMLTSKQTQTQLKQFFNTDDKITDYCFALKSNTENIFRSLYQINIHKFITQQRYNHLRYSVFAQNYKDEYDAHNQDEQTFIAEFISDEFINRNISSSDLSKLQQWINKGVNVNILGWENSTALILSAIRGHTAIVKLLLDVPTIDVNSQNNYGATALMAAADSGHTETVKELIAAPGIDVNTKSNSGSNSIQIASYNGHAAIVELLLATPKIGVNSQDNNGFNALILAAARGHYSIVKQLIAAGIDVKCKSNTGVNSLMATQSTEIAKLLLDAGIDVNSRHITGITPLKVAIGRSNLEKVKLLLAVDGIDISSIDNYGFIAYDYAKTEEIKNLLEIYPHKPSLIRRCMLLLRYVRHPWALISIPSLD